MDLEKLNKSLESIETKLDYLIDENNKNKTGKLASASAAGGISGAMVAMVVSLIKTGMGGN